MRFRVAPMLTFLLGAGLMFVILRLLPLVQVGAGHVEDVSLVIPAVTSETYQYRRDRGFIAVLASSDGRRFEIPVAWLPGSAETRGTFRVGTRIELGTTTTRFTTEVEKLE